jgi:hypothetical protein
MCCSYTKTSIRTAVAIANHGPTSNNPNPSSDPGSIQVFHHVHDTRLSSLAALLWRGCGGDVWDNGVDDEDATWRDLERAAQLTNR